MLLWVLQFVPARWMLICIMQLLVNMPMQVGIMLKLSQLFADRCPHWVFDILLTIPLAIVSSFVCIVLCGFTRHTTLMYFFIDPRRYSDDNHRIGRLRDMMVGLWLLQITLLICLYRKKCQLSLGFSRHSFGSVWPEVLTHGVMDPTRKEADSDEMK